MTRQGTLRAARAYQRVTGRCRGFFHGLEVSFPLFLAAALFSVPACQRSNANQVVAKVSGVSITRRELDEAISRHGRPRQGNVKDASLQRRGLETLILERVLLDAVMKTGSLPDMPAVDAELTRRRHQFPTEESWQTFLAANHTNEAELRRDIQSAVLRERVLSKIAVAVSDAEIVRYYAEHASTFITDTASVRGRMAFTRVDPRTPPVARRRKLGTLEKLRAIWLHDDCKQHCDCADDTPDDIPDDGIDTGPACDKPGKFPSGIAVAVGTLAEGSVTPVVQVDGGYAIFQLGERRAASVISYERAREDIRYNLTHQKRAAAEAGMLTKIVCDARPEIYMKPGGKEIDLGCPKSGAKTP